MPVNVETAQWLVSAAAAPALAAAMAEPDPASLAAATRLRRDWAPDQAAAVLAQAALRRKARAKFGDRATGMFFTPDGLEQATRAGVAAWRASEFASAGATAVVDLGCGLGADALAFADAGLLVTAIDADPVTAVFAEANLAGGTGAASATVLCGDALSVASELLADGAAVFIDPARRTAAGRTWRAADFSPPWDFAVGLLAGRFGCVKAAPGLPSQLIPAGRGVTWVSDHGDLVETSLWPQGPRQAVLLPAAAALESGPEPSVGPLAQWLYEPDPAVIRARATGTLAEQLGAHAVHPGIAYLTGPEPVGTPFATAFEVLDVLPYSEPGLRAWVREHDIGALEIKVRGIDVDPAVLRRRLKLAGRGSATVVLTPTISGARILVVRRRVEA